MNQALMGDFYGAQSRSVTQSGVNNWSVSMAGNRTTSSSQSQSGIRDYNISISGSRAQKIGASYSRSNNGTRCRSQATTKSDDDRII